MTWTSDGGAVNPKVPGVTISLSDTGQHSWTTYGYGPYGNISQTQEYDYGPILVRTTQTDYLNTSAYTASTVHILDRPTQTRVYNGTPREWKSRCSNRLRL
jgi:hypothetical protein